MRKAAIITLAMLTLGAASAASKPHHPPDPLTLVVRLNAKGEIELAPPGPIFQMDGKQVLNLVGDPKHSIIAQFDGDSIFVGVHAVHGQEDVPVGAQQSVRVWSRPGNGKRYATLSFYDWRTHELIPFASLIKSGPQVVVDDGSGSQP